MKILIDNNNSDSATRKNFTGEMINATTQIEQSEVSI
jgi:hypothetical protein